MPTTHKDLGERLLIKQGEEIIVDVKSETKPDEIHITVLANGNMVLERHIHDVLKVELPTCMYILNAMASWMGRGDISYVFPIEISAD
jgi:hypothetical protein